MERATIYSLKHKGWSTMQMATFTGHPQDTIAQVLKEPVDQRPKQRERERHLPGADQRVAGGASAGHPHAGAGADGPGPSQSAQRDGLLQLRAHAAANAPTSPRRWRCALKGGQERSGRWTRARCAKCP
jgi:hypothetical protein